MILIYTKIKYVDLSEHTLTYYFDYFVPSESYFIVNKSLKLTHLILLLVLYIIKTLQ